MSQASEAIIEVAEEPIADLARLRAVTPPSALVARVMTRVTDPPTPSLWHWLSRPIKIELRLSPLGMLATALFLAAALALFIAR